ncbi:sugar transferase [Carboxylicivirga mesophila]|uniref:Sugar transferase n=1 Tax=Carboxylicivirga mesophila TaxID=1166478 RepID=A0ABS5KCC5_9BACT|nr:sugar transferase [Carboxylicivirga mesophila]MBS2212591.1 sugar transferase [Carboxylicivirga mesophila]
MELAPVILFCFNRPKHTTATIEALKACRLASETNLYVFSDGPRNEEEACLVNEVRSVLQGVKGFKSVTISQRKFNMGLASSIISGVTEVIQKHGKVIVLEDDLVCADSFLENQNKMLDYFEDHQQIFSTSAYSPPIKYPAHFADDLYLFPRTSSYGWGTWRDRWESVDWSMEGFNEFIQSKPQRKHFNKGGIDLTPMLLHQKVGKIDSWSIRFSYAASLQNSLCVYPKESMLQHIGTDGSGTHSTSSSYYGHTSNNKVIHIEHFPKEHEAIAKRVRKFWANSLIRQLINFYKRMAYISLLKL